VAERPSSFIVQLASRQSLARRVTERLEGMLYGERNRSVNPCEPELLRVSDAAKLLSMSKSKVYEMAEKGEVPVVRIGTSVRIPRRKLLAWVEERTATSHAA
jgi:excisionase family DNA binding protein